jgi:hypothetical protein
MAIFVQEELENKVKTIDDLETQLGQRYVAHVSIISGRFNIGIKIHQRMS